MADDVQNSDNVTENTGVGENINTDSGSTQETGNTPPEQKYTVTINGKQKEVSLDELKRDYQLKEASYEKLKKYENLSKNLKPYLPVIDQLKKGDLKALKQLGIKQEDILKFSETELADYLAEQELSEDAREAKKERERAEKLQSEKDAMLAERAAQQVESDIMEAFTAAKIQMKGNYRLVRRVAEIMYADSEQGYQPDAKRALKQARKAERKDLEEYLNRSLDSDDADEFLDNLPAKFVDGVRKRELKRVRSQSPLSEVKDVGSKKPKSSDSDDTFREYMRQELRKRG